MSMTNAVIECLMNHRSVRRFKQQEIPETTIRTLISAGSRAATAGNLQMYTFLVVDREDQIKQLGGGFGSVIAPPPLVIIALLDLYRIKRWLEVNDAKAPILSRPIYFMLGFCDATIALQNIVVAAESLGLGTCYYGPIMEFDVQKHFNVPEHVFPAGMICLGYPAEDPGISQRLPIEAIMHKNAYPSFDDGAIRDFYREREGVWDSLSEERKKKLRQQGINSIPQALAVQRFSEQATRQRSEGILRNLRKAGFRFE